SRCHRAPVDRAVVCVQYVLDLVELQAVLALRVAEALARVLPRLAEVGAPPDRRPEPLAGRGREDRPGVGIEHRVVDRPALAVRAAHAPVAAVAALQHEQALAGPDEEHALRHGFTSVSTVFR